jgi:hypothetical protein
LRHQANLQQDASLERAAVQGDAWSAAVSLFHFCLAGEVKELMSRQKALLQQQQGTM